MGIPEVDPRAPRFGQAITATFTLGGVLFREPLLVYMVTVLLVVTVASRWRLDTYGVIWRWFVTPVLGRPEQLESALPHRFARFVGALFTSVASIALVFSTQLGVPALAILGYGVALVVGLLAALGATTGICLGCKTYRNVAFARNLGLLESPSERHS